MRRCSRPLLAAQGVEANLVAVNIDPHYTLTEVATQNFDHASSTCRSSINISIRPHRYWRCALPVALTGKPALNIDTGKLQVIPVMSSARFALASDTDATARARREAPGPDASVRTGIGRCTGTRGRAAP